MANSIEIDPENLYLAFIGFSKRGSIIDKKSNMKYIVEKNRDNQYKPKLFLFEMSKDDKELREAPENLIYTYGLSINGNFQERKYGSYMSNRDTGDKFPTFVKAIYATQESTVQYLYKRIFNKIVHFTDAIKMDDEDKSMEQEVDYDGLFQRYFIDEPKEIDD